MAYYLGEMLIITLSLRISKQMFFFFTIPPILLINRNISDNNGIDDIGDSL